MAEPGSPTRSPFQRDRDRIIHTTAFRRLAHKTQVFVAPGGDHYRTRLTHTIEVSQIARSLARALALDEDLAEALALAHDLGHTPFGHAGEDTLDVCLANFGGFDHNAQALRIVTRLEQRYAAFDGLNLSWETLEGLVKHNGPLVDAKGVAIGKLAPRGLPGAIREFDEAWPLGLNQFASLEAQVAAIADDIAYDAHDIDDGLRAGILTMERLAEVPLLRDLLADISARWPGLEPARAANELMRRLITRFVEDVIAESARLLAEARPADASAVRAHAGPLIAMSAGMAAAERSLKGFLYPNLYRDPEVMTIRRRAQEVIANLFARFMASPQDMPAPWSDGLATAHDARKARRIGDYIAGMTDRYALDEHRRLFGSAPVLR